METIETVISMMTPGCFMTSIDLKDAYHRVPIDKERQKIPEISVEWLPLSIKN